MIFLQTQDGEFCNKLIKKTLSKIILISFGANKNKPKKYKSRGTLII